MLTLAFVAILAWNPSLSATSYTLEYGTSSGQYSRSIYTTGTMAELDFGDGPDLFCAVSAVGNRGTSSPSNELHISGQSVVAVPGGLIIRANDGTAVLDVSNDLKTWAQFTTFTGLQGPTFYPTTTPMFYRLEGTQ